MKYLKIAPEINMPVDAVTEKLGFLGRTGGGKTYAAMKLCELMLGIDAQIVALDPVGKWYGLRINKDGKSKGFNIPVFGGLYGDIPLNHNAGALVADIIVDKKISAVIDVSQFIQSDQNRFAYDFATRLFQRQKAAPSPIHLFIEECQEFIPQNISGTNKEFESKMLYAFERMWKLGRNCGIGGSLISQRPQEVNKKVLNMSECLLVFQMTGPQEKKTIKEWVGNKGLDESVIDTLPYLKQGQCHIWSPVWLNKSQVVKILPKVTFDASATPKVGIKQIAPRKLSTIDIQELTETMNETIEKIKSEDPRELRRQIAELKKQLSAAPKEKHISIETRIVEVPVITKKEIDSFFPLVESLTLMQESIINIMSRLQKIRLNPEPQQIKTDKKDSSPKEKVYKSESSITVKSTLSKCERAILIVLAMRNGQQVSRKQISILSGYSPTSGGFGSALATLNREGYIDGKSGNYSINEDGLMALGDYDPLPTGEDLRKYWISNLPKCEGAILKYLMHEYPHDHSRDEIATLTGYSSTSGGFGSSIAKLNTLELIEGGRGLYKASESLFL